MPFVLRVDRWSGRGRELEAECVVTSGAFHGPERVQVTTRGGRVIEGVVGSHVLDDPVDWPVLPGHRGTVLTLSIHLEASVAAADLLPEIIGIGTIGANTNRIDITSEMSSPLFWATHFAETLLDPDGDHQIEAIFGVGMKQLDQYYRKTLSKPVDAGRSPYVLFALSGGRSVEVEHAADAEYQVRYWIHAAGGERVLLGYESGHASLPGLRLAELIGLIRAQSDAAARTRALSLIPCCYLAAGESIAPLSDVIRTLPGIADVDAFVESVDRNQTVEDLEWTRDPAVGWITRCRYSQRNPKSQLSILAPGDYTTIARFFSESFA
jgi:hypothetical protein